MRDKKGRFMKGFSSSPQTQFKKGDNEGPNHPRWKGGRRKSTGGYILVYVPKHYTATTKPNGAYVFEHRIVAENKLGRPLLENEVVHHINGIKDDNRPENIVVVLHSLHSQLHNKGIPKINRRKCKNRVFSKNDLFGFNPGEEIAVFDNNYYRVYLCLECKICSKTYYIRKDYRRKKERCKECRNIA